MKKIIITVTDDLANTVIQLLFDQCIAFSVEPLSEPKPQSKPKKAFSKGSALYTAVLQAGLKTKEFRFSDVAAILEASGHKQSSASPAISRAKQAGFVAALDRNLYTLTEAGKREAQKLSPAQSPS